MPAGLDLAQNHERFRLQQYWPLHTYNKDYKGSGLTRVNSKDQRLLDDPDVHSLLDMAGEAIFMADTQGRFVYVNAATTRLLGWTGDELLGMRIGDLIDPWQDPHVARAPDAVLDGYLSAGEWQLRRKDGAWVDVDVSLNVLPDGRWQGVARDITQCKALAAEREDLFAQSERERAWLRGVIDHLPVGVVLYHHGGRISFNTHAERLLGMSLAGGAGAARYASRIFHTDGRPVGVEEFPSSVALGGGEKAASEYLIRRDDGTEVPILCSAAPLFDDDGRILGAVAVFQDLSESVRLQRAVRENERLLQAVFELMPTGVRIADGDGKLIRSNRAARELWQGGPDGPSAGEMKAWSVRTGERIEPDEWPAVRALRGQLTANELVRVQCFDGSWRTVSKHAAPLHDDAGRITGAVVVEEDVTTLYGVQQKLQAAVRDREHILAVVAHDLRNPLNTLALRATTLEHHGQAQACGDAVVSIAASIRELARDMSGLVDDLLAVSVERPGQSMLQAVPTSARTLVEKAVDAALPHYRQARLHLAVEVEPELPAVQADWNRMQRVFANLLDNARKFTERGAMVVVRAEPAPGGVLFSVANAGPALARQEMERMFQPFWQAAREDRRGAGLGLSICRSIVEAHGGSVWTEAADGMRVKVRVLLPCVAPLARAGATGKMSAVLAAPGTFPGFALAQ